MRIIPVIARHHFLDRSFGNFCAWNKLSAACALEEEFFEVVIVDAPLWNFFPVDVVTSTLIGLVFDRRIVSSQQSRIQCGEEAKLWTMHPTSFFLSGSDLVQKDSR